ncbi:MAG: glycosyltransferase family 4 protein [bacterium]
MKDILFLRQAYQNFGGIEGQILLMAREFASRKLFNPLLATSQRASRFGQEFKALGFPVYEVPIGREDKLNEGVKAIEPILKKHTIALIQSHAFRESLIGRKVCRKHPEISHVLRVHLYIDCSEIPKWRKATYHILDKLTSRYVDRYVCIDRVTLRELTENSWLPSTKTHLVTDAIEKIGEPDSLEYNSNLPLPARIAMVANFLPHKGHDVLIKALSILKLKGLKVYARLIGGELTGKSQSNRPSLVASLKENASVSGVLDQIEFYGYTRSVYDAVKGYPVIVLPSRIEGIPNCILEALTLKKLVIASHVGGVPEIIQDGINGFLHPPQDPKALADILERVFTAPAERWHSIRDAGYRTWEKNFSVQQMIDGLSKIYKGIGVLA